MQTGPWAFWARGPGLGAWNLATPSSPSQVPPQGAGYPLSIVALKKPYLLMPMVDGLSPPHAPHRLWARLCHVRSTLPALSTLRGTRVPVGTGAREVGAHCQGHPARKGEDLQPAPQAPRLAWGCSYPCAGMRLLGYGNLPAPPTPKVGSPALFTYIPQGNYLRVSAVCPGLLLQMEGCTHLFPLKIQYLNRGIQ